MANEIIAALKNVLATYGNYRHVLHQTTGLAQSDPRTNHRKNQILMSLQSTLYNKIHCKIVKISGRENNSNSSEILDLMESLSDSNMGNGTWSPHWKITEIIDSNKLKVEKNNGIVLWINKNQFFSRDKKNHVGKIGYVRMLKEWRNLLPGFYTALSNAVFYDDHYPIIRFYWNITQRGASLLTQKITTMLNVQKIPFRFKILYDLKNYNRADAAVLYIHSHDLETVMKTVATIYEEVEPFLNTPTPLFAKKLKAGLSLAESPKTNESFGQHRCRLLASFILNEEGIQNDDEILRLGSFFKRHGVDMDHIYRNLGSKNQYQALEQYF